MINAGLITNIAYSHGKRLFEKGYLGMVRHQDGAKLLNSEGVILLYRYRLRFSLTFQTTSKRSD